MKFPGTRSHAVSNPDDSVYLPVWEILVVAGLAVLVPLSYAYYVNHIWEDYFITFRHSKNLCDGNGLLYNTDERLHGFTSPLGTLLPAFCHVLTGQSGFLRALWLYRVFTILAFAGGAALIWLSFWKLNPADRLQRLLVSAFYLSEVKAIEFTTDGMETAFMLLFVSWAVYLFVKGCAAHWLAVGLCWAGLMWTRPDGCIYIAALVLGNLIFGEGPRKAMLLAMLKSALVCTVVYLPWFLGATLYYGSPVPHTIIAKSNLHVGMIGHLKEVVSDIFHRVTTNASEAFLPIYWFFDLNGWVEEGHWTHWFFFKVARYLGLFCMFYWLLPVADRFGRMASFAFVILCLYICTHWMSFPWYYPPVTLLGTIVLVRGAFTLAVAASRKLPEDWIYAHGRKLAVFVLLFFLLRQGALFALTWRQMVIQDRVIEMGHRRVIGEWLNKHVKPGESIYLEPFGYIGYFSAARIDDYPGLVSPKVVRIRKEFSGRKDKEPPMVHTAAVLMPDWMVVRPPEIEEMSAAPFFGQYALVKVFNVIPKLRGSDLLPDWLKEKTQKGDHPWYASFFELVPGPSWLRTDANLSIFKKMTTEASPSAYLAVPYPIEPTHVLPPEDEPTLVYVLRRPTPVTAVRLTFSYENTAAPRPIIFSWRGKPGNESDGPERSLSWPQITTPGNHTRIVWLDDTIELFRISPGQSSAGFRLIEILFLEPVSGD